MINHETGRIFPILCKDLHRSRSQCLDFGHPFFRSFGVQSPESWDKDSKQRIESMIKTRVKMEKGWLAIRMVLVCEEKAGNMWSESWGELGGKRVEGTPQTQSPEPSRQSSTQHPENPKYRSKVRAGQSIPAFSTHISLLSNSYLWAVPELQ